MAWLTRPRLVMAWLVLRPELVGLEVGGVFALRAEERLGDVLRRVRRKAPVLLGQAVLG